MAIFRTAERTMQQRCRVGCCRPRLRSRLLCSEWVQSPDSHHGIARSLADGRSNCHTSSWCRIRSHDGKCLSVRRRTCWRGVHGASDAAPTTIVHHAHRRRLFTLSTGAQLKASVIWAECPVVRTSLLTLDCGGGSRKSSWIWGSSGVWPLVR